MAFKDGAGSQTLSGFSGWAFGAVASVGVANIFPLNNGSVGSTATTALLQFSVDNNGGTNSDAVVEVSTTTDFVSVLFTTTLTNVANGTYSVTATGLTLNTKYYWRVRAAPTGTTSWGPWSGNGVSTDLINTSGATKTASSINGGSSAWQASGAFDGVIGGSGNTWASDPPLPQWLKVQFASGQTVAKYKISCRTDDTSQAPKDFTFQGSNDGSTWTTLDTQTGQAFSLGQTKTYTVASPASYTYYRVHVTATNSTIATISELSLHTATSVISYTPWSFTLRTDSQQGAVYLYENVGIYAAVVANTGEYVYANIGVEATVKDLGAEYIYENVGYERLIKSFGGEYIYEGDVSTNTPIPHIWWLDPTSGRPGDGFDVVGFGFGDLQTTYNGKVRMLVVQRIFDNSFITNTVEGWSAVIGALTVGSELGDSYIRVNPFTAADSIYRSASFIPGVTYIVEADVDPVSVTAAAIRVDGVGQGAWGPGTRGNVSYEFTATASSHVVRIIGQSDGDIRVYRVTARSTAGSGIFLNVVSWQTFPPTVDAYTALRRIDGFEHYTDTQHQIIGVVVPDDAIPPGYLIEVETDGP